VNSLEALGWDADFARAFDSLQAPGLRPARVLVGHAGLCRVAWEEGELLADFAGRLRLREAGAELPVVGDWVAIAPRPAEGRATVHHVLERRSRFSRKVAGDHVEEQVVAANVDTVFLVSGLDGDHNPRRLERFLTLVRESGAEPVVLLNKADLCDAVAQRRAEAEAVALGLPLFVIEAKHGRGLEPLEPWLRPGRTIALLGSSGVGKSTLANRLLGVERQKTRDVRESDDRGRHTTSARELLRLPGGALLIDTPGMRELQLWEADEGLGQTFADVEEHAAGCRFRDCAHEQEPGCAVRAAVDSGALPAARLASWVRLRRELKSLADRQDAFSRRQAERRWIPIHKSLRKAPKKRG
jgi:ribosome biogenesis GTPase